MPKKTWQEKLRIQRNNFVNTTPSSSVKVIEMNDLKKSIILATGIVCVEIALFFLYYQPVWERR